MRSKNYLLFVLVFAGILALSISETRADLATAFVADGFNNPIYLTSPPGDDDRLFAVEQVGYIRIIKNGSTLPQPFLDISGSISNGGERGLLGLAFHPDYANNGYFFVNYTNNSGNTAIARAKASADPDLADPDSLAVLLTINQPYANHNAGMLAFSPVDGYLYIGLGDGGSAGDPQNLAQDSASLLGKMLRIDVDGTFPYSIPPDNPYIGHAVVPEEVWAFGLRNPWRYSFDRETGDLYIADVGQYDWEEVSFQSADSPGGENYGWRLMEGNHCFNPGSNCDPGGLTYPIHEYSHSDGCSITGGFVYRGCALPDLRGTYFFADYCTGSIWSFKHTADSIAEFMERSAELAPGGGRSINNISSFGEDARGELYIIDRSGGEIFKIVASNPTDCNSNGSSDNCDIAFGSSPDDNLNGVPDECEGYLCGDANADETANVSDAVYIINYIFTGGPAPEPLDRGDVNCETGVNVSDAVWIINYVFLGGAAPCEC